MRWLIALALAVSVGSAVLVTLVLHRMRREEVHEPAMTAAMIIGMAVGLTAGAVAGLVIPEDLWLPTVAGVIAGVVAGLASGHPGGLMAMLEGSMSGLMGGAMGAMMGGMLPTRGIPVLVAATVMTLLASGFTVALLTGGAKDDSGHHPGHGEQRSLPARVWEISAGVAVVVAFAGWFGPGALVHRLPLADEHVHTDPIPFTVTARDLMFAENVVTITAGKPVRLTLQNSGQAEHDLTVPGMEYRLTARRDRRAEPPGLHLYAGPGNAESLEFVALRTGTFQAHCSVPGHKEAGMMMQIVVVDTQ